ncbi:MAG: hypothetical protein OXG49_00880 [Chloroflexi bacterium]|nr:hypothetical protein [Chloroflexota bacterium]
MKHITLLITFVALLIPTVAIRADTATVDLSADPSTRAQQAIALAVAQGQNVQTTASKLAAFINGLENPSFVHSEA